jgi:hypothetical protein
MEKLLLLVLVMVFLSGCAVGFGQLSSTEGYWELKDGPQDIIKLKEDYQHCYPRVGWLFTNLEPVPIGIVGKAGDRCMENRGYIWISIVTK